MGKSSVAVPPQYSQSASAGIPSGRRRVLTRLKDSKARPPSKVQRILAKEIVVTNHTPPMTHATASTVVENTNIQTAGPRGPALLQDIWLIEKLAHFDR